MACVFAMDVDIESETQVTSPAPVTTVVWTRLLRRIVICTVTFFRYRLAKHKKTKQQCIFFICQRNKFQLMKIY